MVTRTRERVRSTVARELCFRKRPYTRLMTTGPPVALLAALVDSPDEGVIALDRDLRYVFVNAAAQRLIGLTSAQVLGRTPTELFPPEVVDAILPHIRDAVRAGRMVRYDAYYPAGASRRSCGTRIISSSRRTGRRSLQVR